MEIKYDNGFVTITIPADADTIKNARLSASGKSKLVASTGGTVVVNGTGLKLNLNLTAPA